MKKFNFILSIIMLLFAIGFNLWLYRMEPTVQTDPNDNTFQFALVYRTNQIWDFASKKCSGNILTFPICHFAYLADHWVPNWNEGYNLPFYYSHIPQIVIVGSWRFIHVFAHSVSLFQYYHFVIYSLLCFFPLSVYLALLIIGVSPVTAGFGALLASQISTDGLYGLDPSSFLWRGYGLSSQLFAMIWLPLTLTCSYRSFKDKRFIIPAIVFLVLTTAGHLGIGIMAFLSLIPFFIAAPLTAFFRRQPFREILLPFRKNIVTLCIIAAVAIFFLSYWILPAMTLDKYHNFSFWDPVWKFNSYGVKEIITRLGNGALFDFGRIPLFTGLIFIGLFAADSMPLTLLFFMFLLLYFGRTTWGNILNVIPSMNEFHLSRFIVGVHAAGLLLAPIGLGLIWEKLSAWFSRIVLIPKKYIQTILLAILIITIFPVIYAQTIRYAKYNDTLIIQANTNYANQSANFNALVSTIQDLEKTDPGRVFSGRGGAWGKDLRIAETPMYMYMSNFAIPTVLWLPETWSPNGDTEQYFEDNYQKDYDLYNIHYVVTPVTLAKTDIQPFWKLLKENPAWKLYTVDTSGYFTAGVRPAIVATDKYSFDNVIRLWIQSDDPKNGLYPQLTFDTSSYPVNVGLPNFKMLDEVTYQVPDGSTHNVFAQPPKYISDENLAGDIRITDQTNDSDMIFKARVTIPENCTECIIILKQTFHPDWRVTVDGKPVTPVSTFPFYIGIPVNAGNHTIIASYEPSRLKIVLLSVSLITLITLGIWYIFRKLGIDKKMRNTAN